MSANGFDSDADGVEEEEVEEVEEEGGYMALVGVAADDDDDEEKKVAVAVPFVVKSAARAFRPRDKSCFAS